MEAYSNFHYYNDKDNNSHSAGYMFNEKGMQKKMDNLNEAGEKKVETLSEKELEKTDEIKT